MVGVDKKIRVDSGKGVVLEIDTASLNPGIELQDALNHLLQGGEPSEINQDHLAELGRKKSLIGDGENALIVRFDVKVVRIDERLPVDLGKLVRSPGSHK